MSKKLKKKLKKIKLKAKKASKALAALQKKQLAGLVVEPLTENQLKESTVSEFSMKITKEGLDHINQIITTTDYGSDFKDNLVGYSNVLTDGKFTVYNYINAVKYVTFKMMGYTNKKAYKYTFPERYNKMKNKGVPSKDIMSTISVYNRGMLVQKLLGQSAIKISVFYSDEYHKAVRRATSLLTCGNPMVEQKASASLLQYLKPDDAEVNQTTKEKEEQETGNDLLKELIIANTQLANTQLKAIKSGKSSAKDIITTRIIPGEVVKRG